MAAKLFSNLYTLGVQIGAGSFGSVHKAKTRGDTAIKEVAVKVEIQTLGKTLRIRKEFYCYTILKGGPGIPKAFDYIEEITQSYLVMELLGNTLGNEIQEKQMDIKKIAFIADQIIHAIEFIHNKGIIHRDLKPSNMAFGTGEQENILHIIDFGEATTLVDRKTGVHKTMDTIGFVGSSVFCSLNAHRHLQLSRRDDLISIGYVIIKMITGTLPWYYLTGDIMISKKEQSPEEICVGCPAQISSYLAYCSSLEFTQEPDYAYLSNLMKAIYK